MVSAIDQVTAKVGEEKSVQQAETITGSSPQQQQQVSDTRDFLENCLSTKETRFLSDILGDPAVLNFARYTRLRSTSRGSIKTYLAHISKTCKYLKVSPAKLVQQLRPLNARELQKWFTDLAEYYLFKKENPVKGSTMMTTHFALVKLLKANDVDASVIEQIKTKFQVRQRKPLPFTRDEVKAILKTVSKSRRDSLWIWLFCQAFARAGVIYTLTYGDFINLLEDGQEAGLIWIDGEQRQTKERISHDLPISPEIIRALKARRQEIETKYGLKITRENASQFPVASYEDKPTRKMGYEDFLVEVRRIVHRTGVQGQGYGKGGAKRYMKDVHTGFRGFCMSQWRGNTWLAKYFAGHAIPQDAMNYVHFETVDAKEKIADYLQFRPRPFDEDDMVQEACIQLSNLGFEVDSKIRELLMQRLPDGERRSFKQDCVNCNREAALERQEGRDKSLYYKQMRGRECFPDFSVVQTPPSTSPIFPSDVRRCLSEEA